MVTSDKAPIVLLGGFLSQPAIYTGFSQALSSFSGRRVHVVATRVYDWALSVSKLGWLRVINKLDATVKKAAANSGNNKVTLIGHSQGGILARLYLSPEPFMGKCFGGLDYVDHLITLGSPHLNQGGVRRGGPMSRWVEQRVPGSTFAPEVRYTTIAGKFVRGNSTGSHVERFVYRIYKEICLDGEAWGDGIVPVPSAHLPGSQQITLDGVSHYSVIGKPWYGSEEALPFWWGIEN